MVIEDTDVIAALMALAGVRTGEAVAQVGAGPRVERGLLAMAGSARTAPAGARVAVAGGPADVPEAAAHLAPGGRLVALAPDAATARTNGASVGVDVQHLVILADGVAWSGRLTGTSRPRG